jgi:hypothetical protein
MKPITPNAANVFAVGGLLVYWAILVPIVDQDILRSIFNSLSLGVSVMVTITWAPAAWFAFRQGAGEGRWQLIIAVFLMFCVLDYARIIALISAFLGRPDWFLNGPLVGFVPYSVTIIAGLFLIAPGRVPGAPPHQYLYHIVSGVFLGALLAGFMIGRSVEF